MKLACIAILAIVSVAAGSLRGAKQISHEQPVTAANHTEIVSTDGVLNVTLELDVFEFEGNGYKFNTRAFNGQIPGPTLRVFPGDKLIITLKNNLEDSVKPEHQSVLLSNSDGQKTTPYQHPNATNLHTHGWHVSPSLGSDNVLDVMVGPGESFQYTYEVPTDHMPGTFWYHTHLHGSTMLQTGGGAAGMLMIDTPPAVAAPYPAWLKEITQPQHEQLMMINTIPFTSLLGVEHYSDPLYTSIADDKNVAAATAAVAGGSDLVFAVSEETSARLPTGWNTSAGPMAENNQYQDGQQHADGAGAFPPGNLTTVTNVAFVNGKHQPSIKLESGKWKLWKILHAGPFFFMDLTLEPDVDADVLAAGPKCEMQLLAKDGIYADIVPRASQRLILPPAGRADVAIRCTGTGKLRLVSGARPGRSGRWSGDLYWNPSIASVEVVPDKEQQPSSYAAEPLTATPFIMARPAYLRNLVAAPASDVKGTFDMKFVAKGVNVVTASGKDMYPHNGDASGTCLVNGLTFNRNSPLGTMKVNTMQEWSMSGLGGHPLHLHVNPFQINEITDAVFSPTAGSECDLEFGYTCIGDWLDTVQLPTGAPAGAADVKFRFMTDTFVGHEVMHCHYLNHEDTGCMTFLEIEKQEPEKQEPEKQELEKQELEKQELEKQTPLLGGRALGLIFSHMLQ